MATVACFKVRQDDLALPRVEAVDEGEKIVRDRVRHGADLSEVLVDHLPDSGGLDVALSELLDQLVVKPGHRSLGLASVGLEGPVDGFEMLGLFLGKVHLVHEPVYVMPDFSSSVVPVTPTVQLTPDRVQALQDRLAAFSGVPVGGSAGGSSAEANKGYEWHSQDDRQGLQRSLFHLESSYGCRSEAGPDRPVSEEDRRRLSRADVPLVVIGEGLFRNVARPRLEALSWREEV